MFTRLDFLPCWPASSLHCHYFTRYLLGFLAFIAIGYEEAGDENDQRREEEAATAAIAVQDENPSCRMYLPVGFPFPRKEQLAFLFQIVMRSHTIYIVFQSPENFGLIDADVFLEFLHFLLIEGFHAHHFAIYHIVEGIAQIFQATVHVFDLGGQKVAGCQNDEAVEVNV